MCKFLGAFSVTSQRWISTSRRQFDPSLERRDVRFECRDVDFECLCNVAMWISKVATSFFLNPLARRNVNFEPLWNVAT